MKRIRWLLPVLMLLSGCAVFAQVSPKTDPMQVLVVEMPLPDTTGMDRMDPTPSEPVTTETEPTLLAETAEPETTGPEAAGPQTAGTTPTYPEPANTEPSDPEPANTEPSDPEPANTEPEIPYQTGDTTPTWRPELAERYPPDRDCDASLLLEKWMAVEGLTITDLEARGCRQLILAAAQPEDGVMTLTVCYERGADGRFAAVKGLDRMQGFVGKNGIMHDRRRNSDTSPAGLWAIESAFGNEAPPEGLKLPWRQVTQQTDWVCDDASPYFNTWQERDDPDLLPWSDDVEHLADYPTLYAWACVLSFNRPPDVVPERGCAIFLHCAKRGTGGCVGLRREDMRSVLCWLDQKEKPYILITGTQMPNDPG